MGRELTRLHSVGRVERREVAADELLDLLDLELGLRLPEREAAERVGMYRAED